MKIENSDEIEIQYAPVLNERKANLIRHRELAQEAVITNTRKKLQEQMTDLDIKYNKREAAVENEVLFWCSQNCFS